MEELYIGHTMYVHGDMVQDRQLTCIGSFRDVVNYLTVVRRIPIVDSENLSPEVQPSGDSTGVVAEITKAGFYTKQEIESYMWNDSNSPYVLQEFGTIDVSVVGLPKKYGRDIALPEVVIDIIDQDAEAMVAETTVMIRSLKELFYLAGGNDPAAAKTLAKTIRLLDGSLTSHRMNSRFDGIFEGLYTRPSILFCGEQEYRSRIRQYLRERVDMTAGLYRYDDD